MKFQDLLFVIQTGASMAAAATGNPLLVASVEAGRRLVKAGIDAYNSGRERSEWTAAEVKHFDEVILPSMTAQDHWVKQPEPTGDDKHV